MTVKELIEALNGENQDAIVILSGDAEGNRYSPMADISIDGTYIKSSSWRGEVYPRHLTKRLIKQGYTEEDVSKDGPECIVLWPVN